MAINDQKQGVLAKEEARINRIAAENIRRAKETGKPLINPLVSEGFRKVMLSSFKNLVVDIPKEIWQDWDHDAAYESAKGSKVEAASKQEESKAPTMGGSSKRNAPISETSNSSVTDFAKEIVDKYSKIMKEKFNGTK